MNNAATSSTIRAMTLVMTRMAMVDSTPRKRVA
jgi:hypothetical protein